MRCAGAAQFKFVVVLMCFDRATGGDDALVILTLKMAIWQMGCLGGRGGVRGVRRDLWEGF